MYSGPAQNMCKYFATLGYPCPINMNPTEYVMDTISVDYSTPEKERKCLERIKYLSKEYKKSIQKQPLSINSLSSSKKSLSVVNNGMMQGSKAIPKTLFKKIKIETKRFSILLRRAWRQVVRDKALNIARFSSSIFSALLFGAIYFNLGSGASTVADRLGLLQVAAVNTAMTALIKATTSFVSEKMIVQRERRGAAYSVAPYFVSKLLAELPLSAFFPCLTGAIIYKLCGLNPAPNRLRNFLAILTVESIASSSLGLAVGSFAPSVDAAIAIAPAVMVIFIVFGGLYVVNAPSYLAWVAQVRCLKSFHNHYQSSSPLTNGTQHRRL